MKKLFILVAMGAVVVLSLVFSVSNAFAGIPHLINYQGMLTDNSGTPLSGSYNLTFKIYDDTTTGTLKWSETQSGVSVLNGLFNVVLGKVSALNLAFDQSYWLEVGVGAETMPRMRFTSVGYAYRAQRADTSDYAQSVNLTPLDSRYVNEGQANSIDSGMIKDHSIVRSDVATYFKAPYSDTADYAKAAPVGASANTWTFRITDGADTTITTGGRWGIARYGNMLYGNADSTHVNLGVACTTGASGQSRKYCTVSGGKQNVARDNWTTVGGGSSNLANGSYATVSGGGINQTYGDGATIGGGWVNSVTGSYATVAGGQWNVVGGTDAAVGGGANNVASAQRSTVGGGYSNQVAGDYSAILGGYGDTITSAGDYSYLFGIKSRLTQDSTFMVDMPHIRFGDETDGYEFPTDDGTSGQVMQTNGSGRLSWANLPSGSGWTDGGTKVYLTNSSDSVGVGTSSPTRKLQVEGGVKFNRNDGELVLSTTNHNNSDRFKVKFDNNCVAPFVGDDTEDQYFSFYSGWSATRAYDAHLKVHGSSAISNWGRYIEITHDGSDGKISTDAGSIILSPAGNVGIGTTTPTSKLDINGLYGYSQLRLRQSFMPDSVFDPHGNYGDVAWEEYSFYIKTGWGWQRALMDYWGKTSGTIVPTDTKSGLKTDPQEVLKLQPKIFKWKASGREDVVLMAEEVEQHIPDLVIYDKKGKPDAVKYDGVTLYLLEVVKEQQKRIETLEEKLNKLESAH